MLALRALLFWILLSLWGGQQALAQTSEETQAKAAALFRNAFELLERGDYSGARAGFEQGLSIVNDDVNAWLYYGETLDALWRLEIVAMAERQDFSRFGAITEAHGARRRPVDEAIKRLQPSDEQLASVLHNMYRIYPGGFNKGAPSAPFRFAELVGKKVCAALPDYLRQLLEREGITFTWAPPGHYVTNEAFTRGPCQVGLGQVRSGI